MGTKLSTPTAADGVIEAESRKVNKTVLQAQTNQ